MKFERLAMKIRRFLAILTVLGLLTSCGVYFPQTTDIPLIHEKKDLRIDAGVSILQRSFNGTVSYGVSNKIAAQAFGNLGGDHQYYQGAMGYFKNLKKDRLIEIYGGTGFGNGYYSDSSDGESINANYILPFAQMNFGRLSTESSKEEFGVGLKAGFLHSNVTKNTFSYGDIGYDYDGLLIEPIFFYRPGLKRARLNIKLSGCWLGGSTSSRRDFNFDPTLLLDFPYSRVNLGVSLNVR